MDVKEMTAPCGCACFACGIYKDNITDEVAQQTASMMGIETRDVPCEGCRSKDGCTVSSALSSGKGCLTNKCVDAKGLHNCSECNDFPCENLMPVADLANNFPHNTKIYNLSRIRLIGLEAWGKKAAMIQQKYFKGKFVYGQGPVIEGEE